MNFKKISIGKGRVLNATYRDTNDDVISLSGANVVHRDMREAMEALVSHFAILTESREAGAYTLSEIEDSKVNMKKISDKMSVSGITFSEEGNAVSIEGTRILGNGSIMKIATPPTLLNDTDSYIYCGELSLALEKVTYEAQLYIKESKWGIKEGELFGEDVPFEGVKAEPAKGVTVSITTAKSKKGKKQVEQC